MSYITSPVAPTTPSLLKRLRVPIIVLFVAAPIIAAPFVWSHLDLPEEAVLPLNQIAWLTAVASILMVAVWWLFLSSFRWFIVLPVALLAAMAGGLGVLAISKFELTATGSGLVPRIRWAWESSAEDQLATHLDQEKQHHGDALPAIDATVGPEDFAEYRGPKRDGVVPYLTLETDWSKHPPEVLWRLPCPGGYGGVAVAGNIVVTLQQRGDQEVIVCYDRATGRQRWAYAYDAYHKDVMGDGPRSTPTIHAGRIFTVGATGELVCMSVAGQKQWSINILEDSRAKNIKWGLTASPLIVGDLVIAHAGIDPDQPQAAALVAFEQATGKKRWAAGMRRAGYGSPQLVTLAGVAQILIYDGEGLASFGTNGKELWNIPWKTKFDMNMIQPVIVGEDRVFISAEASEGCALYRVKNAENSWNVEAVWQNKNLGARYANPVSDGKNLYALHSLPGELRCLDLATGRIRWKGDRHGPGQMLLTKNALLVVSDKGVVTLHALDTAENEELARFAVLNEKTWNTPALAGDQLFVRNQHEIACIKLPRRK